MHGELGFQRDAQHVLLDSQGHSTVSRQNQLSYLVGLRYLNAYDTTFIGEYYHNGGGYSRSELNDLFDYQDAAYAKWLASGDAAAMERANRATRPYYGQRTFGQDYFYFKIIQKDPFNILYFSLWLATIINLQDGSFNLQPGMAWLPVTNLELNLRIGIPIGPAGTEYGEKQDTVRPEIRIDYYF